MQLKIQMSILFFDFKSNKKTTLEIGPVGAKSFKVLEFSPPSKESDAEVWQSLLCSHTYDTFWHLFFFHI